MENDLSSLPPASKMAAFGKCLPGVLGFCSVAFGAFGSHALKARFGEYEQDLWKTATLYLMVHSLAGVLAQCLFPLQNAHSAAPGSNWAKRSIWFFVVGASIFSFSLFLLALTGVRGLGAITPIGGVLLLLGWASLSVALFQRRQI